jgi:hypothetical protein
VIARIITISPTYLSRALPTNARSVSGCTRSPPGHPTPAPGHTALAQVSILLRAASSQSINIRRISIYPITRILVPEPGTGRCVRRPPGDQRRGDPGRAGRAENDERDGQSPGQRRGAEHGAEYGDSGESTGTPASSIRRSPSRSPSAPAVSSSAASVSVYPLSTHCTPAIGLCRSRRIVGTATLSTLPSRMIAEYPRQIAKNPARRPPGRAGSARLTF